MHPVDPPRVRPVEVAADDLVTPASLDLTFEGFATDAFALLRRLREHPHIEQYRKEKAGIRAYVTDPFKRFRDDLVVNWVLPNRLDFETEKNVFSRLLKNDFGAGGCHHHLWLAFYRPGWRRLTDVQLSHSLTPDGFETGLFVGEYGVAALRHAKAQIQQHPERFLALINPLLQYKKSYYYRVGGTKQRIVIEDTLPAVPDDLSKAEGFWVRTFFPRQEVVNWRGGLVRHALQAVSDLWPLYRFLL